MCRVMEVSRSGYYRFLRRKPSKKELLKNKFLVEVKAWAAESRNSYGKRMISKNLQALGYKVGIYQARTLMRDAGIICKQRRRYRITTKSDHGFFVAENVLNRQFTVDAPNKVWITDITYLWTLEGGGGGVKKIV